MEAGIQRHNSSISAPWVQIQQKTFTNWVNEQLKPVDKQVEDLVTDFEDGLLLIALMDSLVASRGLPMYKKRTSYCKNPRLRVQKMENVSHALQMMEKTGIKMVNVGNEDIVEGNLKLILGMIWRIIQRFQLSGGGGVAHNNSLDRDPTLPKKETGVKVPPKKLMLKWVNSVLPEDAGIVKNFSNDWNDGVILSALLNYCDPELMTNWRTLDKSNKLENCREAMGIAQEKFSIPMVVSPEDLSSKHMDELSGMTYISYFLKHEGAGWYATLNWVRKNVPEEDVKSFKEDWNDGVVLCGLVTAVGGDCADWKDLDRDNKIENCQKGIEAGRKLGVEPTLTASELSQPDVDELNVMAYAAGFHRAKPFSETFQTSFGAETYAAAPQKTEWGLCAKIDLSRSTGIDNTSPDVEVHGATAEVPVTIHVRVLDQQVSVEDISAQIESPGSPVPISLKALSTELVEVQFTPLDAGMHKVSVRCRGEMVRGSPVRIKVEKDMSSYPKNVKVGGNASALIGEELQFQVDTQEAGQGDLRVDISNGHSRLPVRITRDGRVFTVHTTAKECGSYVVDIKWNGQSITDDPMRIAVRDPNKCKAMGEGLSRAREDTPAIFTVDPTAAGPGELRVQVEGPNSMAKVSVDENRDGTYTVTYIPVEVGMFTLKMYWADKLIQGSPYHIKVTDPRKVRVVRGSIKNDQMVNGMHTMVRNKEFKIVFDSTEAGPGTMQADLDTPTSRVPLSVTTEMQGRQSISFTPDEQGEHEMRVTWCGYPIKGSPLKLYSKTEEMPVDHTKVKVRGDGMEVGKVFRQTEFTIDGARAGPGVPNVRMSGLDDDIDVTLTHVENNVYRASYTPEKPGTYLLHLTWNDRQVNGSPFKVNIAGESHANRVKASGGALKMLVSDQTSRLVIDGREAGAGDLTARCMGPNQMAEVHIGDNQDNTFSLLITPKEQGRHVLEVKYGQDHIQGSPFVLRVAGAPDASQVVCFGSGLEHGMLSTFRGRFICETKGAGAGQLKVRVHGPKGAFRVEMKRSDTRDRTIDVLYNPTEVGDYTIHVKWSDKHVPGSPFLIKIVDTREQLEEVRQKFPTFSSMTHGRTGSRLENGWAEEI